MSAIELQKKQCRLEMRQIKRRFSVEQLQQMSAAAVYNLCNLEIFRQAETVMLYHSLPDEVDTHALICDLLHKKRIILPVIVGEKVRPVELLSENLLSEGAFHIMEPQSTDFFTEKIDLIIVPGVAFDSQGHRLGRGKGYYDEFLSHYPEVQKIGLCFDFQLIDRVPIDAHDKCMDAVITN